MSPADRAVRLCAHDPDGQLTKRRSGAWIPRNAKPATDNRFDTATVQECVRAGWFKSTPSREGGRIRYAVTITPAGADAAGYSA